MDTVEADVIEITCRGAALVPLAELEHFQGELKKLSEDEYQKLRNAIVSSGFSFPLFVWRDPDGRKKVIDGHQRLYTVRKMLEEGCLLLGDTLPVAWIEADSEMEAKKKVLLAASQYGRYTVESVSDFITASGLTWPDLKVEIDLPQINMPKLGAGFSTPDPKDDEVPDPPKKAVTKLGDLWELGDHRLLCGDSTKVDCLALLMAEEVGHCIFTDPPYGVCYDGGQKKRDALEGDAHDTDIYAKSIPLLAQVVDSKAPLYLWYADGHAAGAAAAAAGYCIVAQVIWAKNHAQFVTSAHYAGKHEPCYYGHKRNKAARWFGPNNEVTLWECNRAPRNDFHPTQKPVELACRAIHNSTSDKQIVVDGFLGGGTTMIAAEKLNRRCYSIEIEPRYVDVAVERWEQFTGGKAKRIKG